MVNNRNFVKFLKGVGLITGPSLETTRHTNLGKIKGMLCGNQPDGKGIKPVYLAFGTILHERFLLRKATNKQLAKKTKKLLKQLTPLDLRKIEGMLKSLNRHPVVIELMKKTKCEKTFKRKFHGINFQFTPDAVKLILLIGLDLKTTACDDLKDFIEKAFGYGYFRQSATYMEAHTPPLKDFYIIGIGKTYPHQVFIVHVTEHKDKFKYAQKELEFLLYFYLHYGTFKAIA